MARVVHGLPLLWEPIPATFPTHPPSVGAVVATWSPCNRFIAISDQGVKMHIVDAVTLKKLSTFEYGKSTCQQLCFSPDSQTLTQVTGQALISWDLQTGGLVSSIPLTNEFEGYFGFSSAHSMDGKMIAAAFVDDEQDFFIIATYDLLARTCLYSYDLPKGHLICPIWTHGERIRFATMVSRSVSIWEVGFSSINNLVEVETFLLPEETPLLPEEAFLYPGRTLLRPDECQFSRGSLFLPSLSRLAYNSNHKISIWDAQNLKLLLAHNAMDYFEQMSFSSDGHFFACAGKIKLCLWKESPGGYTLHQNFATTIQSHIPQPLLSPNGESVIMVENSSVSVCPTREPIISPFSRFHHSCGDNHLLEFSPDKMFVAVILLKERNITILNLESGDPLLVIDVDIYIVSVRVTASMIVVANWEKVVAWDIPARGSVLNTRLNIENSSHITTFNHPSWTPYSLGCCTLVSPDLNYVAVIIGEGVRVEGLLGFCSYTRGKVTEDRWG
jgi:WD40 repeat protein